MKTRCSKCRKLIEYGNRLCDECKSKEVKHNKQFLKDKDAEKLIKSSRWKELRKKILMRDKSCVLCKQRGQLEYKGLQVHHIEKRTNNKDLAFEPTNLVTVCRVCHEELEKLSPTEQKELLSGYNLEMENNFEL